MANSGDTLEPIDSATNRLLGGSLAFEQPAEGFRAPIDGLLLAAFAPNASRLAVDLGAGAGMVTLALLARAGAPHVIAVERDAAMADILARNLDSNGFSQRATVLAVDVLAAASARRGCADLVVANPPFWLESAGTPARHERARSARLAPGDGALSPFLHAARTMLGRGGRICIIWPAASLDALFAHARSVGVHAKRARFVHPLPTRNAHRVLVEFKPGRPGGLTVDPPLYLFDAPGVASAECLAITGETT